MASGLLYVYVCVHIRVQIPVRLRDLSGRLVTPRKPCMSEGVRLQAKRKKREREREKEEADIHRIDVDGETHDLPGLMTMSGTDAIYR